MALARKSVQAVPKQLALRLDRPLEHLEVLHHDASKGTIILFLPGRKPQWLKLPAAFARSLIGQVGEERDVYVAVNRFFGWRRTELLSDLCALYCELDIDLVPGSRHTKASRAEVDPLERLELVQRALSALEQARIPSPTLIVYSAGGPHFYWIFDQGLSPNALPRWQYLQDRIIGVLDRAGCGVDTKAKDAARVLREIGSIHGKTGLRITGEIYGPYYDFEYLHGEIAERGRAELRDLRVERAKRKQGLEPSADARRANRGHKTIYSWWHTVFRDLLEIVNHHWFGGIPEGHRDEMLFLMAVALSWFTHPDTLRDEIIALAREWTPSLTEAEALAYVSTVLRRAHDAAAGVRYKWTKANGETEEVDPRYRFKPETLYERLRPLITPELRERLRAIAPAAELKARKNTNDLARITAVRRDAGVRPMASIQAEASDRAERIALLRAQGLSWKAVALELGVTEAVAKMALKRNAHRRAGRTTLVSGVTKM